MLHFRHTVNLNTPILLKLTPWKKIIGFLTAFLIHTFRAVNNQEKWSFFQSVMQNTSHLFEKGEKYISCQFLYLWNIQLAKLRYILTCHIYKIIQMWLIWLNKYWNLDISSRASDLLNERVIELLDILFLIYNHTKKSSSSRMKLTIMFKVSSIFMNALSGLAVMTKTMKDSLFGADMEIL